MASFAIDEDSSPIYWEVTPPLVYRGFAVEPTGTHLVVINLFIKEKCCNEKINSVAIWTANRIATSDVWFWSLESKP